MAEPSGTNPDLARIADQLDDLRRLTILQLVAFGVQSSHIAKTLGVHSSAISRMMPVREIQKAISKRSLQPGLEP